MHRDEPRVLQRFGMRCLSVGGDAADVAAVGALNSQGGGFPLHLSQGSLYLSWFTVESNTDAKKAL